MSKKILNAKLLLKIGKKIIFLRKFTKNCTERYILLRNLFHVISATSDFLKMVSEAAQKDTHC
jgi:hypothetical protein